MGGWRGGGGIAIFTVNAHDEEIVMSTLDDVRWQIVTRREPADFLYAVTTMGIYCRPGCPSPAPKRTNVRYFPAPAAAEAEGFRACKRCDPKGERVAIAQAVVRDACAHIEAEPAIPSLETLAKRSGYSRFHFLHDPVSA